MTPRQEALAKKTARMSKSRDFKVTDPDLGPEENDRANRRPPLPSGNLQTASSSIACWAQRWREACFRAYLAADSSSLPTHSLDRSSILSKLRRDAFPTMCSSSGRIRGKTAGAPRPIKS